mmetsp:Transcript_10532/g.20927  ORF Transcript_10532/g.20927 Transcript_10532/m.20927 type:complete len:247 (+) Transcript_10532:99-839(+)
MSKASGRLAYPKTVAADFRNVNSQSLFDYADFFAVECRPDAPPAELACTIARHFETTLEVDEEAVLGGFLDACDGKKNHADAHRVQLGTASMVQAHKRKRAKQAARAGEQVAAKVSRSDENGSWILASVQSYSRETETYDVQDEDDVSKLIRLAFTGVMRLGSGSEIFTKGSRVLAIFPETTSFYKAVVSKAPVWSQGRDGTSICSELILKFEDDEDETGKTPHRRVPSRYVISVPEEYFDDNPEL